MLYPEVDRLEKTPSRQRAVAAYQNFPNIAINRTAIAQDRLDLVTRNRSSMFPWRGQFSPELIELLLTTYADDDDVVLDPFVGSGTVLFESAYRSLACFGAEIHPAAVAMASTAHFVNIEHSQRIMYLNRAENILRSHLPSQKYEGIFEPLSEKQIEGYQLQGAIHDMFDEARENALVANLLANTLLHATSVSNADAMWRAFREHSTIVKGLPFRERPCRVFHTDVRRLPLADSSVDIVITSPPYINVFNYHQYYRPGVEMMGWDVLRIARSEFGSNRKHRGNRFLTVVQYTVDMLAALREIRRTLKNDGRVILIVGRESNVRGIQFENGRIVAALAIAASGFQLAMRQERKFKNKFGEVIFEDILHFTPSETPFPPDALDAYILADYVLKTAPGTAEVVEDLNRAKRAARTVSSSPIFHPGGASTVTKEIDRGDSTLR